jgi:hypothetical protein
VTYGEVKADELSGLECILSVHVGSASILSSHLGSDYGSGNGGVGDPIHPRLWLEAVHLTLML